MLQLSPHFSIDNLSLPLSESEMALRRHWDQGQNDKLETHTAGLELRFNKGNYQAHWKPGGTGRLSVKRIRMTVNPFLVVVPRDWGELTLLAKERFIHVKPWLAPRVPLTSQSILKVGHQMFRWMYFHLKFLIKPHRLEKLTNEGWASPHLVIMFVPKAAWQSRAPVLPSQRKMCCWDARQVTGVQTSEKTAGE